MKAVAATAILLGALAVRDSIILPLLAFLVLTNVFLRLYLFLWPVLSPILVGSGKAAEPDDSIFSELFRDGDAWRGGGRFAEALECYEEAARLIPDHLGVAIAMAYCCKRIGHLDRAIALLTRAGRDHPGAAPLHYNLACYLSLAGEPVRALDELALALELDPSLRAKADADPDFDPIRGDPGFG